MIINRKEANRALQEGQFVPYFQPLVTLRTGQLSGFEVLARWQNPRKGLVLPGQFIHAAETDGWVGNLMKTMLCKAFVAAKHLPSPLTLAINVSPVQLRDLTLPRQIQAVADQAGFPLERLIVEITESALTDNLDHATIIAKKLKQLGCRIALDDFGTGYSSLLHLQALPFDDLKVDRSFVSSMTEQRDSRKIVAAVVGLGQSLGLTTVAEGIETREQAEMLLWMGCELGQGWLFGRPVPVEELSATVVAGREKICTGQSNELRNLSASSLDGLPSQRLAQLQAVYDGAPVGLAFLDRNFRYVSLNKKLADMNGLSVAEHLGHTVGEILPLLFPIVEPYIRRAMQGEVISGIELTRPDGTTGQERSILLSYQPAFDEAHEVIGVSVSVVDVTDRKTADEALRDCERSDIELRKTQAQLKAIVATVPLGIILSDTGDGSPSIANPEAIRILGEPLPALIAAKTSALWLASGSDGKLLAARPPPLGRALLQGHTIPPEDVLYQRSDGTETWVSLSGAPILGQNDEVVGGIVVMQDIDSQKHERQRLLQLAEALVKELEP
jgi:PAS domain S-box-containing protein